ncbi:MAG TPA: tetratricopeptide repeat protein [Thermoanaerobaculia bacterium]|nr:tetratricopeptide repeat protein [Thermoanaerobaculia bacterium]
MSNYPGNASLASAVREKVSSTFQQTLALFKQGRNDEVIAGCNLILQMDPMFDPARKLMEKVKNPSMSGGSADLSEARAAMAARDFERVVQLTTEVLTNDLLNDEARVLADEAREKMEAGPFIDQFVRKCEQSLANGNVAAARADLEKARALDASHPGVLKIQQAIAAKEGTAPASFDASSFVVDTPPAAAKPGGTQASDFGFTFEEEKTPEGQPASFANFSFEAPTPAAPAGGGQQGSSGFGGFSFDTPAAGTAAPPSFSFDTPAPAKPPAANDFDFSTASIETSPDDQKKIEQYLAEGDRAFDSGNYQQAIDLWSRIFLIDVTNEPASERIERAKGKRREAEKQVESILAAGVQAFDRQDIATARAKFEEVLKADPGSVTAQDYMERLQSPAAASGAVPPSFTPAAPSSPSFDSSIIEPAETMYEEPEAAPAARKPGAKPAARPAPAGRKLPMGLIAAVIAAIVVIGGGWFVWSKFSAPKADVAGSRALLDRAAQLSGQGKYDLAISTLQDIKPGDPQYDKALNMIADVQQKKARAATTVEGKPATAFFQDSVNAGRAAFEAHDYVGAKKAFEQAIRVKPLPADVKASYDIAAQQVGKLDNARTLFVERKYQDAIAALQPLLQQDPQNQNIQRMIVDAHFNLGAVALQEEKLDDAKREFDEVLKTDPNDELAKRSRDLAERYDGQTKDLLYKIYVKYLPLRQPPAA